MERFRLCKQFHMEAKLETGTSAKSMTESSLEEAASQMGLGLDVLYPF